MGYTTHDAVIVTINLDSPNKPDIDAFRDNPPNRCRHLLIGPIPGVVNNYRTWIFTPDGSQDGFPDDLTIDEHRTEFITICSGFHGTDVVHVRYGGDYGMERGTTIEYTTDTPAVTTED